MKNTARQQEAMKQQTIGVEVEMNNITRQKAAKVAADFFGTGRYEYTASRNGYMTWSAWDAQGREWKFQRDVSISGPDEEKVRDGHPDPDLRRHGNPPGARPEPPPRRSEERPDQRLRGPHPHRPQGWTAGHTPPTPCGTWPTSWPATRSPFRKAMKIDEGRTGRYCQIVNPDFLARVNRQKPQTMQRLADCWYEGNHASYGRNQHYNDSRYHMLYVQ